jgi:molybdopterin converting factor small subunit
MNGAVAANSFLCHTADMNVSVVCFGAMRDFLPENRVGNRADVDVGAAATVGDLVDALGAPRRLIFSVLVDGVRAGMDTPLSNGGEVTLMPPFAGGS